MSEASLTSIDWSQLGEPGRAKALARPHQIRDETQLIAVRAILADVRARGRRAAPTRVQCTRRAIRVAGEAGSLVG